MLWSCFLISADVKAATEVGNLRPSSVAKVTRKSTEEDTEHVVVVVDCQTHG